MARCHGSRVRTAAPRGAVTRGALVLTHILLPGPTAQPGSLPALHVRSMEFSWDAKRLHQKKTANIMGLLII